MNELSPKMRFLIVDDMANMRRTIKNMLRSLGIEKINEASDGDIALSMLESGEYDFVICDWNMPNLCGLDLLRKVKDSKMIGDIPFLMVTAEVTEEQIVMAAETEVDGYIIKPFVAQILEDKIISILDRRKNPSEVEKKMKMGQVYLDSEKYEKALETFEEALELNPNSARIRHSIGEVYLLMGEDKMGEQILQEAAQINPQFIKVHQTLGEHYMKSGNADAAMKSMETAAKISPNNPERQTQLGKIYLKKGRVDKAEKAFSEAVKHDSNSADRQNAIGEAYLEAGFDDKAAEAFRNSISITKDVHTYNRLGIALRKKKRYEEAIEEYHQALLIDENDEALYYNLGRAYLSNKQVDEARACFHKALELVPDFAEAEQMLDKLGH